MHSSLRFLLFGVCAAAGIGLAVSFAFQMEPTGEPAGRLAPGSGDLHGDAPEEQADSAAAATTPLMPSRPAPATGAISIAPQPADYHPLVANQVNQMERALEQVQHESEQTRWVLDKALSLLSLQGRAASEASARGLPSDQTRAAEPLPAQTLPPSGDAKISAGEGDGDLIININNRDIREVLELLSQQGNLNILPSKNVTGTVSASLNGVDILTALDVILKSNGYVARREGNFIYVGTPQDFQAMETSQEILETRIYRPNYVTAQELQTLVTPILTTGIGVATVSTPSEKDIAPSTDRTGSDSFAGGDVLLVQDFPSKLLQVDRIVAEVDRRPQQVSIEAMILSVKLDDSHQMGVNFEALHDKTNVRLVSGSPFENLGSIDVTQGGLKFGFLDSSLGAFVTALETVGDANVVAAPRLMCLNKQRAEILIGSQLGYVSTTVTENAATQTIDFLDVGTQLRLRPYISADGMVRLEIHPELSTGNVRVEEGFTLPDKEVTQVTTNIMCPDGCTVIIGGLIREDLTSSHSQVPLLGSLPVLGHVFRQRTESMDRREIIVLITPRIVAEPVVCAEGAMAACEFDQRRELMIDHLSKWSQRHYGRRYCELAAEAAQRGDVAAACRYCELALHFDPTNMDAIRLRDQMQRAVVPAGFEQEAESARFSGLHAQGP